jgi:hypothetical protein
VKRKGINGALEKGAKLHSSEIVSIIKPPKAKQNHIDSNTQKQSKKIQPKQMTQ